MGTKIGYGEAMIGHILTGFGSLFSVTTPPLYRYPYRSSHEGLQGDMGRVAADIAHLICREADDKEA